MNEILTEFKKRTIKDIEENPKLLALDAKIAKLEKKLSGIKLSGIKLSGIDFEDFEDKIFKFKKRLEKIELNKFGYTFSTDDNGKN